jgi:hypothetical protein
MTRLLSRRVARLGALASLAIAASTLSGCAALIFGGAVVGGAMVATDRRTSGTLVEDEMIELKAKGRMSEAFPNDDVARINTTSYNRMVLLTGEVPTDADKVKAEQTAARIENVSSVVNELSVGPVPKWMFETSTEGERISTAPTITSSACVARSASARKTLSLADSWMPRMLSTASTMQSPAANTSWPSPECSACSPGSTDRYGGTVYDEIAIVTV